MSKHTSGKWIVEYARINQGGKKCPYVMSMLHSCCIGRIAGNTDEEAAANGHLIAAAPELLEALEEFERACEDGLAEVVVNMKGPEDMDRWNHIASKRAAAIAKAKGET